MWTLTLRKLVPTSDPGEDGTWPAALAAIPDVPDDHAQRRARLAVATSAGDLVIWRLDDCIPERVLATGLGAPVGLRAHPDGRRVVLADIEGDVEVWDVLAGLLEAELGLDGEWAYLREPAYSLALIHEGRFALVSTVEDEGPDCFQAIYDLEDYTHAGFYHMGPGPIELVAGTSEDEFLFQASNRRSWLGASWCGDGDGRGRQGWSVDHPHPYAAQRGDDEAENIGGSYTHCLVPLRGFDLFASGGADGTVRIWDDNGPIGVLSAHQGAVLWIAGVLTEDSLEYLAVSVSEDGSLVLWSLEGTWDPMEPVILASYRHGHPLVCCEISEGGEHVVVIDSEGSLLFFGVEQD